MFKGVAMGSEVIHLLFPWPVGVSCRSQTVAVSSPVSVVAWPTHVQLLSS